MSAIDELLRSRSEPRIYLDNAATSWPKPEAVYKAVDAYQRQFGVAVGRSAYRDAVSARRLLDQTRLAISRLIGAPRPEQVIFTFNGTDSLNIALHGLIRPGDHVVTTILEHNSVLRPLAEMTGREGEFPTREGETSIREGEAPAEPLLATPDIAIKPRPPMRTTHITYVGCDAEGRVDPIAIRAAITPHTRAVVMTHASNVLGTIQSIEAVGEVCRKSDVAFIVDAAQTLGHIPICVADLPVDVVAASGHKGLLGPLGTGVLYMTADIVENIRSFRQGGTGTSSESDQQPVVLPEKFESGNLNMLGIAGLSAAIDFLTDRTIAAIRAEEIELTNRLLAGLSGIAAVNLFGPASAMERVGVVSFTVDGTDSHELATMLDLTAGIQVRSGLHCAPRIHQRLDALDSGTVRASLGPFNTVDEVEALTTALQELTR